MRHPLHDMVYDWHERRAQGAALWAALRGLIARLADHYPAAYFECGVRDDAALDSLTNRVFTACDRVRYPYDPFVDREPFRAFTEDRLPSPPIRYHTVYRWCGVTRSILSEDYRKNIRRDPALQWRDRLYRTLSRALPEVADPAPSPGDRRPGWRTRATGPLRVRTHEDATHRLLERDLPWDAIRALDPRAVGAFASAALDLLGAPISQSALAHLLADALRMPASSATALSDTLADGREHLPTDEQEAIRLALLQGWAQLDPLDRRLAAGLARGEDADTLLAADPRINSRASLTRAFTRVSDVLLAPILARRSAPPDPDLKPQRRVEVIMDVLLDLLPELP